MAVFWNPTNPGSALQLRRTEAAARALGVQLVTLEVKQAGDIETAFHAATKRRADALAPLDDPVIRTHQRQIVALAAKSRLPAIYGLPGFAEEGGLVVYGPNTREMLRRAATFVDKILKGARPADIPVEQPTRFELVINTKTAKALGLTIPQSVLFRADKVIE